jgi:hypothetical protein
LLSKVPKFKVALEVRGLTVQPTSTNVKEFKEPMPVRKMTEALGKRPTTGKASTLDNL